MTESASMLIAGHEPKKIKKRLNNGGCWKQTPGLHINFLFLLPNHSVIQRVCNVTICTRDSVNKYCNWRGLQFWPLNHLSIKPQPNFAPAPRLMQDGCHIRSETLAFKRHLKKAENKDVLLDVLFNYPLQNWVIRTHGWNGNDANNWNYRVRIMYL